MIGFPPGAGIDIALRLIAPKMAETLGQTVVVDNRPGAGGNIAAELAARAPADGYTLLGGGAPQAISQMLYAKLTYYLLKDFDAVALVASVPNYDMRTSSRCICAERAPLTRTHMKVT